MTGTVKLAVSLLGCGAVFLYMNDHYILPGAVFEKHHRGSKLGLIKKFPKEIWN